MNERDRDRYSRQIRFCGIGLSGQQRLLEARVAVVGCGALGSFQVGALLRAGVRRLVLVDRDYVELNNLQRQWLYDEEDAECARPKAEAAARHLLQIDGESQAEPVVADLDARNIGEILDGVHLILDGTDNFETRYLINDFAVQRGIFWIYGGAVGSYGIAMPIVPGSTCCFSCLYPQPPAGVQSTCETAGVVNVLTSNDRILSGERSTAASLRTPVRGLHHDHRRLGWRNETGTPTGSSSRLRGVWTQTFFPSRRPAPGADQPLRAQRGTDPLPWQAGRSSPAEETTSAARRGSSE